MISKVKGLIAVGENLEDISKKVKSASKDISDQSKELSTMKEGVAGMKLELVGLREENKRFSEHVKLQTDCIKNVNEELKKELYDFKLIKSDIKSKLVSELAQDFRNQLREETKKLDTDVKQFNDLKTELSGIVAEFHSVEGEIRRFKEIASRIKTADFELVKHARELDKADSEKIRMLQKIDQLEHLVSKMRRSTR